MFSLQSYVLNINIVSFELNEFGTTEVLPQKCNWVSPLIECIPAEKFYAIVFLTMHSLSLSLYKNCCLFQYFNSTLTQKIQLAYSCG